MIPLVDLHCHLLAGLDDGPRTDDEALAMCRMAYDDGTQMSVALAHQSDHWPANTPERIRQAVQRLAGMLRDAGVPLTVCPCAEVMANPALAASWQKGEMLSIADRGDYLLIEMPDGLFVDLSSIVEALRQAGVRPVLAHPERHEELLHDPGRIEDLIKAGCLVQVSAASVTRPANHRDERALKGWFKRGVVHVLGSDGHSPTRRRPRLADAYHQVARWAGNAVADRVASTNGVAILQGLPLHVPEPEPGRARWFSRLW